MQNLRQLSGPELGELLHCVDALTAMHRALPEDLYIKLDTYRADLLAEQEDRPKNKRGGQPNGSHCRCVCAGAVRPQRPVG